MPFGERWFFQEGDDPIRIYHRETDARVHPGLVDAKTGNPIDPRELYAGPGPAFPPVEEIRRQRFTEYYARHGDTERR